jgi:hypothetical protein
MNLELILGLTTGGLIIWEIVKLVYDYYKMGQLLKKGGYELGHFFGRKIKKYGLDKITNEDLKAKAIKDLDAMGNEIDRGWDDGLKGVKNA